MVIQDEPENKIIKDENKKLSKGNEFKLKREELLLKHKKKNEDEDDLAGEFEDEFKDQFKDEEKFSYDNLKMEDFEEDSLDMGNGLEDSDENDNEPDFGENNNTFASLEEFSHLLGTSGKDHINPKELQWQNRKRGVKRPRNNNNFKNNNKPQRNKRRKIK